jgi:hypothetical protein
MRSRSLALSEQARLRTYYLDKTLLDKTLLDKTLLDKTLSMQ